MREAEVDLSASVAVLQLAIAAGYTPRNAVTALANELGAGAQPFVSIAGRLAVGAPTRDALFHQLDELGSTVVRVLHVIDRADVDGLDALAHLETVAADIQRERLASLDIAAQKLGVRLLFPLILCILPAFLCLSMIPLVLDVINGLPG